jgi:hypothetical protein
MVIPPSLFALGLAIGLYIENNLTLREFVYFPLFYFINTAVWGLLMAQTLKGFRDIRQFVMSYVILRTIEVSIFGLIQLLIVKSRFVEIQQFSGVTLDVSLGRELASRLTGLFTPNAVNAAFYLMLQRLHLKIVLPLFLINLLSLILTGSRLGYIGGVAVLVAIPFFLRNRSWKIFGACLAYVAICYAAYRFYLYERMAHYLARENILYRMTVWERFVGEFWNLKVFGIGDMQYVESLWSLTGLETVENTAFQFMFQGGYFGGIIYLGISFLTVYWLSVLLICYMVSFAMAQTFNMFIQDVFPWLFFFLARIAFARSRMVPVTPVLLKTV